MFLPTTHQTQTLRVALLISAVIHAVALLWIQIDYPEADIGVPSPGPILEVTLISPPRDTKPASVVEPRPEIEPVPPASDVAPTTRAFSSPLEEQSTQSNIQTVAVEPPLLVEAPESTGWQALVSTYAAESVVRNIEQERRRDAMWRKTFSVMFAPPDDWLVEDEPYLPDLKFEADKPKGLGIKIGENCYLGFPGVDPQTVDSDTPGWSGGGAPQPTINLITCGFGK